jgi:hypothetical protein
VEVAGAGAARVAAQNWSTLLLQNPAEIELKYGKNGDS